MNALHTKAPWEVGPVFDNGGQPEITVEHKTPFGNLVVAVALGGLKDQKANARLIAAAPDMLAALLLITQADPCIAKTTDDELRAAMEDEDEGEEQEVREQARAFLAARAAIAKATGGQA